MIKIAEPHWLLGQKTVARSSPDVRLVSAVPQPYPQATLTFGSDFCDREKVEQQEKIRQTQVPHLDQHGVPLSQGQGRGAWFNASVYGRFAQVRSVVRCPVTGKFQMIYLVHGNLDISADWTGGAYAACYAESHDGIHWVLPNLGKYEVFGAKENNVIFPPGFEANIVLDLHDPDERRRYKALLHPGPKVAFSANGIDWSEPQPAVVETKIGRSDGDSIFGWDDALKCYVAYLRPWGISPEAPEGTPFKRKIGRAVSDDFVHWKDHALVMEAEDSHGGWHEIERMHVFRQGSIYFGLAAMYEGYVEERVAISHMIARTHCELVYSEDGVQWQRFPERKPFLKSFSECGMCLPGGQPAISDKTLYFYYSSSSLPHGELPTAMSPCLARVEFSRLFGWRADDKEGYVETQSFVCPGGCLDVYADISREGYLRVSVLAEDGMHHLDYAVYRCGYIQGASLQHRIVWQRRSDLHELEGEWISLKFYFKNADISGFVFNPTQNH